MAASQGWGATSQTGDVTAGLRLPLQLDAQQAKFAATHIPWSEGAVHDDNGDTSPRPSAAGLHRTLNIHLRRGVVSAIHVTAREVGSAEGSAKKDRERLGTAPTAVRLSKAAPKRGNQGTVAQLGLRYYKYIHVMERAVRGDGVRYVADVVLEPKNAAAARIPKCNTDGGGYKAVVSCTSRRTRPRASRAWSHGRGIHYITITAPSVANQGGSRR